MWAAAWTPATSASETGKAVFYDMDLPEVIALRRELIPEEPGNPYIAASLLETEWMDDLRRRHPDGAFIFVVEGVLMYFYEKQGEGASCTTWQAASAEGEIWFDVCGTMMRQARRQTGFAAQARGANPLGAEQRALVEQWEPALHLLDQANYMKFFRRRWGFFFGQSWDGYPALLPVQFAAGV